MSIDNYLHTLVHIASDNAGSTMQMNDVLGWPNTLLSPNGCHVERNRTYECLKLTTTYWMIMALSDIIISPFQNKNSVQSGFPRFAFIYGLKGSVLRNPTDCDYTVKRDDSSRTHQGNWVCLINSE